MSKFLEKFGAIDKSMLGTTKQLTASTVIGDRGDWQKMIDIATEDGDSLPITVSLRSEYFIDLATGLPGIGQPLVGLAIWGTGGAQNQVEFDIPCSRLSAGNVPVGVPSAAPMTNIGSGVQFEINGSGLSLYARHDGNIAPIINSVHRTALGLPPNDWVGIPGNPAKLLSFVSPGQSMNTKLQRTIYVAGGNTFPGLAASALAPGEFVDVSVPPFAKAVRFQRGDPSTEPLNIACFSNNAAAHRFFNVPVNVEDWFLLDGQTITIEITNTGAAAINRLQAVFDVTPL